MSSRTLIDAVMAEVRKDFPDVQLAVGRRETAALCSPPNVAWLPTTGEHKGLQQAGHNPRPIANRVTRWDVRCWGADLDTAEALMASVVRGVHLALTSGGGRSEGENWLDVGEISQGEAVVVQVLLGVPITDRAQPTTRADTLTPAGTFTP